MNQTVNTIVAMSIGLLVLVGALIGISAIKSTQGSIYCSDAGKTLNGTAPGIGNCWSIVCDDLTSDFVVNATKTDECYNSTNDVCSATYDADDIGFYETYTYNITKNAEGMSNSMGSQLGTVGTMFGVALILASIGLIGYGIARGTRKM